ncbi:MAG: hypothetical protein AABX88_02115 [Nanoarchaeota archaeon]
MDKTAVQFCAGPLCEVFGSITKERRASNEVGNEMNYANHCVDLYSTKSIDYASDCVDECPTKN